jgi:hypothetical protein
MYMVHGVIVSQSGGPHTWSDYVPYLTSICTCDPDMDAYLIVYGCMCAGTESTWQPTRGDHALAVRMNSVPLYFGNSLSLFNLPRSSLHSFIDFIDR